MTSKSALFSHSSGLARRRLCLLALAACTALGTKAAQAADYPTRTVEIIVPWAVGGGSDAVARAFADAATRLTGNAFIIVNRPGASGSIGHLEGTSAKPDGYKLTLVTPEISLAYLQGIGKTQWQDFQYVARINADPIALVVRADAPWTTLEQFLGHVRSNPGKVTVSPWRALAAPRGTPPQIMESLRQLVDKVTQDKTYRDFFARQYLGLVNEDGDRFRAALERENAFYASTVSQLQLGK